MYQGTHPSCSAAESLAVSGLSQCKGNSMLVKERKKERSCTGLVSIGPDSWILSWPYNAVECVRLPTVSPAVCKIPAGRLAPPKWHSHHHQQHHRLRIKLCTLLCIFYFSVGYLSKETTMRLHCWMDAHDMILLQSSNHAPMRL